MNTPLKTKFLLGTSILAMATLIAVAPAHAQINVNGGPEAIGVDPNADPAITFTTDDTATVANNVNITGTGANAVTAGTTNFGTLAFSGNSTVTGDVGINASNEIKVLQGGAAASLVTINGDVGANLVTLTGTGTLAFNGNLSGSGNVNLAADGTVQFADNSVIAVAAILNSSGAPGSGTLSFLGSATVTADVGGGANALDALTIGGTGETVAITGSLVAANTTTIGTNAVTVSTTFDLGNAQTLAVTLSDATTAGSITSTDVATVNAGALVTIDAGNFLVNDGTSFVLIDSFATSDAAAVVELTAGNITVTNAGFLTTFTQDTTNTDDLVVVASLANMEAFAVGDNNLAVADILSALGTNGDAGLDSVFQALQDSTSTDEYNDRVESLQSTTDGGVVAGGTQAFGQFIQATTSHLNLGRQGVETGVSAGDYMQGLTLWAKGFGQTSEQDLREGIDGYDADTYGAAVGIESEALADNVVAGIALSYAVTDVDSENANRTQTDIDSYQASVYSDFDIGNGAYITGLLGYGYNDIDQTRYDVAGTAGNNAKADYDSQQYIAYAELGRAYKMKNRLTLTPSVLAHYQHINVDDYSETGSTGNLDVDTDTMDIFEVGAGVAAAWDLDDGQGNLVKPSVDAGYRYDVIGDNIQATNTFTGGGASFKTQGADPAQHTFNVGAGITYDVSQNWSLTADYDYQFKSDYDSHSASVRAGYKF